jgi:hypothetical protein
VRELSLAAESYGREPTELVAQVADYDRAARVRRALRIGLPLALGALLSIPVPGWHFIGVPGFAVAAVVMVRRRLRQTIEVTSLGGPCPACGEPQTLAPPFPPEFPATVSCPSCQEFLKLSELR